MSTKTEEICVDSDPCMTLAQLAVKVAKWTEEHGENAIFCTDAGYNNVSVLIKKEVPRG